MANVKITDLTAYTDAASTDVLPVVDVSNNVTKKISIADLLKAAPLGSAAAPGIAFDGDPNTGVYSPGADQVAISTNGAQRVAVDASGNVAFDTNTLYVDAVNNRVSIGTANSVGKLTVATSSADPSSALSAWSDGHLVVTPGGTTTSGGVGFSFNTSTNVGGISCASPGSAWRDLVYKASAHRFELGGSEAARIDSSGRLLVGTSTSRATAFGQPVHQIEGGSSNGFSSVTVAENTQYGGAFILAKTRGPAFQAVTSGDSLGILSFQGANGSALLEGARIQADIDGTVSGGGASDLPTRLVFSVTADGASSPTEHYRITSAGYLSFTSNVGLSNIRQTTYNTNSNAVLGVFGASNGDSVNNGAVYNIEWKMNGNASGQFWYANYITYNGARTLGAYCTGTAWTNSSDIANKEEIVDTRYGLNTILSLRPVDFRWKSQRDKDGNGKPDIGFIAQEVEQIIPEVVTGAEGSKGISYGNLVSVLTKAIQEQQVMIAELQTKVAALEAQ